MSQKVEKVQLSKFIELQGESTEIPREERIQYQLYKRRITLTELYATTDEKGNAKTEAEIREFYDDDNYYKVLERLSKYVVIPKEKGKKNMPDRVYSEVCERLHIHPRISQEEAEEILLWRKRLIEEGIEFKGQTPSCAIRNDEINTQIADFTKEEIKDDDTSNEIKDDDTSNEIKDDDTSNDKTDDDTSKKKKETKKVQRHKIAKEVFALGEQKKLEEINEEMRMVEGMHQAYLEEFSEHAQTISPQVLFIWNQCPHLYYIDDKYIDEVYFIKKYGSLNSMGKKFICEMILKPFEKSDYEYQDDIIKRYLEMQQLAPISEANFPQEISYECVNEIYEKWGKDHYVENLPMLDELNACLLKFQKEDWECLINYHRLLALGKKLMDENVKYLDFIDMLLYYMSESQCFHTY